jgi:S-adenosylmethionine hydrolase
LNMIVLLTDFGQSEYVGVMKAVICSIASHTKLVDLWHDISAQNIIEASWVLKNSYKYFPEGAIFCCVVDPGVGTERKALAVKTETYYFVAPDNGLLWETLKEQGNIDARQIPIPPGASRTFHGRDVFAKAAGKIELGSFDEFREKVSQVRKLEIYLNPPEGTIVRIDRFGNVITNLPRQDKGTYCVAIGEKTYTMDCYPNYEAARDDELFLIEGSSNTLEISLKNGNANAKLAAKTGQRIVLRDATGRRVGFEN